MCHRDTYLRISPLVLSFPGHGNLDFSELVLEGSHDTLLPTYLSSVDLSTPRPLSAVQDFSKITFRPSPGFSVTTDYSKEYNSSLWKGRSVIPRNTSGLGLLLCLLSQLVSSCQITALQSLTRATLSHTKVYFTGLLSLQLETDLSYRNREPRFALSSGQRSLRLRNDTLVYGCQRLLHDLSYTGLCFEYPDHGDIAIDCHSRLDLSEPHDPRQESDLRSGLAKHISHHRTSLLLVHCLLSRTFRYSPGIYGSYSGTIKVASNKLL